MGKEKRRLSLARFFFVGFAFLLLAELAGCLFLDRIYLRDTGTYRSEKVTGASALKLKSVKIDTGSNVTDYQCAYDGSCVSYLKDGVLTIVSLTDGKKYTVPKSDGAQILTYRWIYDRTRLLILEKSSGSARIYYYSMSDRVKTEFDNAERKQALTLPLKSGTASADLDMSSLTNLTYFKLTSKSGSQIYRVDVNGTRQSVSTVTSSVGKIALLKNQDYFLYEDTRNSTICRTGSSRAVTVMGKRTLVLLGGDSSDSVYVAVPESGKTRLIYSGKPAENRWSAISLSEPAALSSLLVDTVNGGVYEKDTANGTLTSLTDHTATSCKGSFIGFFSGGFLSRSGGVVAINRFASAGGKSSKE